ncbi:MAG: hypothetical protein WD690_15395 [Vicinamibacterales bacterium]
MPSGSKPAKDVDAYIAGISYEIPVFKLQGRAIVYFAGFKNHVREIAKFRANTRGL